MRINLFVGPTARGLDQSLWDENIIVHPPIRRGDLTNLINTIPEAETVAIVDGVFFPHPAVGHSELIQALSLGWTIYGLSSMGAIRAYEMHNHGLIGYGEVFKKFFLHEDFRDDEMALLHAPDFPFIPISEPLVNIRYFLDQLVNSGDINVEVVSKIVSTLKQLWFGKRTLQILKKELEKYDALNSDIENRLKNFQQYRIKTIDLANFLIEAPWNHQTVNYRI